MESILGLEFTQNSIKLLELRVAEDGPQVLRLNKIDLPPNSTKDGIITTPHLVANKLSAFLKENNISTKKVVALIGSAYAPTKIIRLPFNLGDDQIRLNLEAEVSQYQALIGKEPVIDFNKLEEISEEGIKKINVIFSATSKALIKSYLHTVKLAGLDLIDLDVSMLCLLRTMDEAELKPSSLEVTLLMLIGERHLEICIVKGNRPRFFHSVEIDMLDFDKGLFSFIKRLVSSIKLVLNFYQVRFMQGEEISRIVINPLDAKYNRIHLLLQEELSNIPIKLTQPLEKVHVNKEKITDLAELRFPFSCLLGATLRLQNKESPLNLNLLLRENIRRRNRLTQIYMAVISAFFLLSVVAVSIGWVFLNVNILEKKIERIKAKFQHSPIELNETISIKEKRDVLRAKIKEAAIVTDDTGSHFIQDIAKAMVAVTDNLWLTDISLSAADKNLVLTGESGTEKSIFDYVSILSGSQNFDSVELVSSKGQEQSIRFVIRCVIKR
jgi:Tfp pilus assembly PilM family ATPase